MKNLFLTLTMMWATAMPLAAENLKPYILAGTENGDLAAVQAKVTGLLTNEGFEVVGNYAPMDDASLGVICISHADLKKAVAERSGLRGLAAVLRVGLHQKGDTVHVSYTTPFYWGHAYFRKDFAAVSSLYEELGAKLKTALSGLSAPAFTPFGSKKGLSGKDLQKYRYMVAMPRFDDVVTLATKTPYADLVKRVKKNCTAEGSEVGIVYAVEFPEQKMALYGISLGGKKGEKAFLPKIDFGEPRHTPFLPYEVLVMEDRAVMLHGKYRIALSFPDLSMGTFMKIVSTPGDIKDALATAVAE
jgi:hypothetical protein